MFLVGHSLHKHKEKIEMDGINLLIEASKRGNEEQIEELLKAGDYKITTTDALGNTCLHWAASGGHVDAIKVRHYL